MLLSMLMSLYTLCIELLLSNLVKPRHIYTVIGRAETTSFQKFHMKLTHYCMRISLIISVLYRCDASLADSVWDVSQTIIQ